MIAKFAIGAQRWPGISKLIEEAGKTQQVCGKLLGTDGREEHWDGTNLRTRLEDELADLRAAVEFVIEANDLDGGRIMTRSGAELQTFRVWHRDERAKDDGAAALQRAHAYIERCERIGSGDSLTEMLARALVAMDGETRRAP